jgi:hypothetical protein
MMTPSARVAIRQVLGQMDMLRATDNAALLQTAAKADHDDDDDDGDAAADTQRADPPATTTTTTPGVPTPPVPKDRVVKRLDITVRSLAVPSDILRCRL